MKILGHGIDLVETARITRMVDEHGERFLERCFTPGELRYSVENGVRRDERLAARFAAKEAVLKAIGTGWRNGIAWTDIEVTRQPSGEPGVVVTGKAGEVAREMGVSQWRISLSHTQTHAMASAIACGE